MGSTKQQALSAAILKLLRPLIRILIRNGMPYAAFADLAKRTYVDLALKEFGVATRKSTNSRAAIITGLSRKEVLRVRRLDTPDDTEVINRYNRAARVISGWVRSPRFADANGQPCALPFEKDGKGFSDLVREFSGDVPARAILDELKATGAVEVKADGRIALLSRAYLPSGDEGAKLAILGTDVADLAYTIDANLDARHDEPLFQRKVAYDNVPMEAVTEFRRISGKAGQTLLERLDHWLADHDRDNNPTVSGTGRKRIGMGIYYFEEDLAEAAQQKQSTEGRL